MLPHPSPHPACPATPDLRPCRLAVPAVGWLALWTGPGRQRAGGLARASGPSAAEDREQGPARGTGRPLPPAAAAAGPAAAAPTQAQEGPAGVARQAGCVGCDEGRGDRGRVPRAGGRGARNARGCPPGCQGLRPSAAAAVSRAAASRTVAAAAGRRGWHATAPAAAAAGRSGGRSWHARSAAGARQGGLLSDGGSLCAGPAGRGGCFLSFSAAAAAAAAATAVSGAAAVATTVAAAPSRFLSLPPPFWLRLCPTYLPARLPDPLPTPPAEACCGPMPSLTAAPSTLFPPCFCRSATAACASSWCPSWGATSC